MFFREMKRNIFLPLDKYSPPPPPYVKLTECNYLPLKTRNSVKRSDVTGDRFEWQLDENIVIYDPLPYTALY